MKSAGRRRFWFVLSFAAAAALYALFHQEMPQAESSRLSERSRSELQMNGGRWWYRNKPFTGILFDQYEGGRIKSRSTISNGFLEGISEGWYTNGVKQVTEHFSGGVSHGMRLKFHPSGKRLSTARIVKGKIEGLYERWYDNGMLAERVRLTNGVAEGESLSFHPDGSLKARAHLANGKVIEQQFWEPGEVVDTAKALRK
jgi:antitoxin component YwqK of YwqJK toxin-antitoxin module